MIRLAKLAKYGWLGWISARSNLAYIAEVGSRVIFLAIVLFIFLRLWQVTFAETKRDVLGGLTLAQMLWYLMVTESITLSAPRVAYLVDQDVRTGSLAIHSCGRCHIRFMPSALAWAKGWCDSS